jgi:hypothetical protein
MQHFYYLHRDPQRWYKPHLFWWYDGQRINFRSENGARLLALSEKMTEFFLHFTIVYFPASLPLI